MIKCSIFGHKRVHPNPPTSGTQSVLDHCDRCKKKLGVWVVINWSKRHWGYFKR